MTGTALTRVDASTGEVIEPTFSLAQYVATVSTPAAINAQKQLMTAYDKAVEALIGDGDVQAAEGGKVFKKKSAWCKLARHFGISTRIVRDRTTTDAEGHVTAQVIVAATAPWGQTTEGVGACSTRERRFKSDNAKAKADHDCLATAATRARNRAIADLIAQGEVSAEEVEHHEAPARAQVAAPAPDRQAVPAASATRPAQDGDVIHDGTGDPKVAGEPSCPKCGGRMWDNRATKRNPKAPDFKCRDRSCDGVIWPPKGSAQPNRRDDEFDMDGSLARGTDDIPF